LKEETKPHLGEEIVYSLILDEPDLSADLATAKWRFGSRRLFCL
jgi:hypothetical protein